MILVEKTRDITQASAVMTIPMINAIVCIRVYLADNLR